MGNGKRSRGFTIIELLIVMVVVGVLTAIAFPSYTSHLRKGRRAQAQAFLMDMAQRQQQYFVDKRSYVLDGSAKAYTTLGIAPSPDLTSYYTITTQARADMTPSFQITATAIGSQVKDGDLTLDDTGAKTPSKSW